MRLLAKVGALDSRAHVVSCLPTALRHNLEASGSLKDVKAKLRADIFKALNETDVGCGCSCYYSARLFCSSGWLTPNVPCSS